MPMKHLGLYHGETECQVVINPATREVQLNIIGVARTVINPQTGEPFPPVLVASTSEPETAVWISKLGSFKHDLLHIKQVIDNDSINQIQKAVEIFKTLKDITAFVAAAEKKADEIAREANSALAGQTVPKKILTHAVT